MADDSFKVKVQLEATADTKQVQKEATEVADTAQKTLDKKELKLKINDNLKELKKRLEETRVAYQNLLNQPMNWTTNQQLEKLEDQMEDLRNEIKENEKALWDLGGAWGKLGNIFQWMIGKITAWGAALKVISFAKKTFTDFQDAQKELVKATGATWEALKWLSQDMLKVQWQVWQSQTEVAQAVWELNTRLWLTGSELQDFTTKYLKFASITGQDGKTAIADNIRLFNIRWISTERQADYLDKLAKAGQMTWVNVGTLTNQLTTNQVALQELWFDLEQSIALLSNFEKAWVDTSSALQAMKIWLNNLVEWWWNPAEALQEIVDRIQNAKSEAEWLQIAAEIFGSRWGQAMFNAIRNGTLDVEAMTQALANAKWTVEDTHKEMETLADFIGRKWNWLIAETTNLINEAFRATRNWLNETQERWNKLINDFNILWKTSNNLKEVWHWLSVEWWYVTVTLDKQGQAIKKNQELTNNLKVATSDMKKALEDFNKVKVDDSATRAEFNASKTAALQAAEAYKVALAEKLNYFYGEQWKFWSKDHIKSVIKQDKINRQIQKALSAEYTWKGGGWDDGGVLGDSLFGWSSGWWGGKSKAEEMAESFKDEMKDLYSEMDSAVNDHQKNYNTLVKNIEKTEKEYDKLRETAKKTREDAEKSIKSYNEQLEKNQVDSLEKLGQRYVELREKRAETDNDYLKKIVWEISDKEWQLIRDEWWTFRGYDYSELKDVYELYKEMKLIEENTTEEQRKATEFTEKTSKAQEILNQMKEKEAELEEKKAQALEKQAIAQAMMNQENGKTLIKTLTKDGEDIGTYYYDSLEQTRKKIEDESNVQYAKQLENQSVNLKDQLDQYTQEKNEEVEILIDVTARKVQLENEYNKVFQEQVAKQKKSVEELISYWDRLIARKNEYYWNSTSARAYGWDISNAKVSLVWENWPEQIVARTASYIQPRNASNSYSTVNNNNSNNLTINWMSNSYGSIDEMLDDLRWRLTYRN